MKNQISKLCVLALVMISAACAGLSVDLQEKGKKVQLVRTLSDEQKAELTQIATIKCELGRNARPIENNKKACENDLRNRAGLDGDLVFIQSEKQTKQDIRCNNCIELVGVVYRNKNSAKQKDSSAKTPNPSPSPNEPLEELAEEANKKAAGSLSLDGLDVPDTDTPAPSAGTPSVKTPESPASNPANKANLEKPNTDQKPPSQNTKPKGKSAKPSKPKS